MGRTNARSLKNIRTPDIKDNFDNYYNNHKVVLVVKVVFITDRTRSPL